MLRIGASRSALAVILLLVTIGAAAQIESVQVSPDIRVRLGGVLVADEAVAADGLSGNVVPVPIGSIPANADLSLYHMLAIGDSLLAFDITVELPGAVVAQPRDVVRYNGASFSLVFDRFAADLAAGVDLDALHFATDNGHLFLSFDTGGMIDGITSGDEDLLEHDPDGGNWSMVYNDSDDHAAGVAGDLDAAFVAFLVGSFFSDGFENF